MGAQWKRVAQQPTDLQGKLEDLISLLGRAVDGKKKEIDDLKRAHNGDS